MACFESLSSDELHILLGQQQTPMADPVGAMAQMLRNDKARTLTGPAGLSPAQRCLASSALMFRSSSAASSCSSSSGEAAAPEGPASSGAAPEFLSTCSDEELQGMLDLLMATAEEKTPATETLPLPVSPSLLTPPGGAMPVHAGTASVEQMLAGSSGLNARMACLSSLADHSQSLGTPSTGNDLDDVLSLLQVKPTLPRPSTSSVISASMECIPAASSHQGAVKALNPVAPQSLHSSSELPHLQLRRLAAPKAPSRLSKASSALLSGPADGLLMEQLLQQLNEMQPAEPQRKLMRSLASLDTSSQGGPLGLGAPSLTQLTAASRALQAESASILGAGGIYAQGAPWGADGALSEETLARMKKERRLAGNREAARRLRKKHSQRYAELQAQLVQTQQAHEATLRKLAGAEKRIAELQKANESLENEVVLLRAMATSDRGIKRSRE